MSEKFTTFKQVNDQETSAYINGTRDNPTVLFRRTDGSIDVGRVDKHTRIVEFDEGTKRLALESLSDQHQMELANELAASRFDTEAGVDTLPSAEMARRLGGQAAANLVELDDNGMIVFPFDGSDAEPAAQELAVPQHGSSAEVPFAESSPSAQAEALNAVDTAQATQEKIFGRFPILRSYQAELNRIASVRTREESEGYRHGMDQYTTSRQMIADLMALVRQTQKYKPGEDLEGDIIRYINA